MRRLRICRGLAELRLSALLLATLCAGCDRDARNAGREDKAFGVKSSARSIRLGETIFKIPSACVEGAPNIAPAVPGAIVERDAVLLAMLLPDMRCDWDVQKSTATGPDKPSIFFLISAASPPLGAGETLRRLYKFATDGHPEYVKGTIRRTGADRVSLARWMALANGRRAVEIDVIGSSDQRSFVACTTTVHGGGIGGSDSVAMCEQHFLFGELLIKASFGRGWLPQRNRIQAQFFEKLRQFSLPAHRSDRT